jgi:hypothetical protein
MMNTSIMDATFIHSEKRLVGRPRENFNKQQVQKSLNSEQCLLFPTLMVPLASNSLICSSTTPLSHPTSSTASSISVLRYFHLKFSKSKRLSCCFHDSCLLLLVRLAFLCFALCFRARSTTSFSHPTSFTASSRLSFALLSLAFPRPFRVF